MKNTLSFQTCMDILDWFNDSYYDYINHILLSKVNGEERINRALPEISDYCRNLIAAHRTSENTYPLVG